MDDGSKREPDFADIGPGQTTEVYLDVTERRRESERPDSQQPALVMLHGDLPGQVFRLPVGRQVIGRRTDCDIRLREKAVSGRHAEIVRTGAGVSVTDLESTNGTVVNGRRIRNPVFLAQGNLLKLGKSVFKYVDSMMEVELSESLHTRSAIDFETGFANRMHFLARAAYVIDRASAARPVSIITIAFELRGRPSAETLQPIVRILRESFDDLGRYIGRIGDAMFAIAGTDLPDVETVRSAFGVPVKVGMVTTTRPSESAESLLARAE